MKTDYLAAMGGMFGDSSFETVRDKGRELDRKVLGCKNCHLQAIWRRYRRVVQ